MTQRSAHPLPKIAMLPSGASPSLMVLQSKTCVNTFQSPVDTNTHLLLLTPPPFMHL